MYAGLDQNRLVVTSFMWTYEQKHKLQNHGIISLWDNKTEEKTVCYR